MQQFHKVSLVLTFFLIASSSVSYGQDTEEPMVSETIDKPMYYTRVQTNLNNTSFRDFATSPLYYQGLGFGVSLDALKISDAKERLMTFGINLSLPTAQVPSSQTITPSASSNLVQFIGSYKRLWKVNPISSEKYNIKLGGLARYTQHFRSNTSLLNNAQGVESFMNLMFSSVATRDVSRKSTKQFDFWFIHKTLNPVKRDLRFGLDLGVLNFNNRPAYAFLYEDEAGEKGNVFKALTSGYRWTLNGWSLGTNLEYVVHKPNGNAYSLSYVWNALHAPGRYEPFQIASHQFVFAQYFSNFKKNKS